MATRTTISLPDDLKRRMDAAPDDVNWSAVAAAAFEAKLEEISKAKQKREVHVDQVVERLLATRLQGAEPIYRKGFADGRTWAHDFATADQLDRMYVLDVRDRVASEPEYRLAQVFARAIDPDKYGIPGSEDDFWNRFCHDATPTNKYVLAFENGARDLLGRVRRRLREQRRCPKCGAPGLVKYTTYRGVGSVGPSGPLPEPTLPSHRITCSARCGEPDWREPFDEEFIRETE